MRASVLPAVAVLALLGLVVLLPKREAGVAPGGTPLLPGSAAAGRDVAEALLGLTRLEVMEPPPWTQQRGTDEIQRSLDRLAWGNHSALTASREILLRHRGELAEEILRQLRSLGETDPILVAKLIPLLAEQGDEVPGVVEELNRRALSENALVARAALRALAHVPSSYALAGILDRRNDAILEIREEARAALARRLRLGDEEARLYVLEELEGTISVPDRLYVTALGESPPDERGLAVLRAIAELAPFEEQMAALSALLVHGDEDAVRRVEGMIVDGDIAARLNAMRMAALAGRIVAFDQWERIVSEKLMQEVLPLMSLFVLAIETGDDRAPQAYELLERIAYDPSHPCRVPALDVLVRLGHPWAVETTRAELMDSIGAYLAQSVDRVLRAGGDLAPDFADVAYERLARSDLGDVERILLCRLVANVDPEGSADMIVRNAMEEPVGFARQMLPLFVSLGPVGLDRLAQELDSDRGAGLFVFAAANLRSPDALDALKTIVGNTERDPVIRAEAMDAIVRLNGGPREEALRELATALGPEDEGLSQRARLLFWNYL